MWSWSGFNGNESKKYQGLLVYNDESFATDTDEGPLLGWIVATTPQTASGGEYVALLDYNEDLTITMLEHRLGHQMIDVGHATNTGDKVCEIVQ